MRGVGACRQPFKLELLRLHAVPRRATASPVLHPSFTASTRILLLQHTQEAPDRRPQPTPDTMQKNALDRVAVLAAHLHTPGAWAAHPVALCRLLPLGGRLRSGHTAAAAARAAAACELPPPAGTCGCPPLTGVHCRQHLCAESSEREGLNQAPTSAAGPASSGTTPEFALAQPMSVFPPARHDALGLDGLLSPAEREVRDRVRQFAVRNPGRQLACQSVSELLAPGSRQARPLAMLLRSTTARAAGLEGPSQLSAACLSALSQESEIAPVIAAYWERAEFPHALLPRFQQLGIGGGHLRGYGCQGLSVLGAAMAAVELVSLGYSFDRRAASCFCLLLLITLCC